MPRKDNFATTRRPRRKGASLSKERTASGSCWPIIFGIRRTAVLMYIAAHPGCSTRDVLEGTGISFIRWTHARLYLQKHGLILSGPHEHHIDPRVEHWSWLTGFLRALAAHHGMTRVHDHFRVVASRRTPKTSKTPLTETLFYTPKRAHILMLLSAIKELYGREAAYAIGMTEANALRQLHHLLREGIVSSRRAGRAELFSLNASYPGAVPLRNLLRAIAKRRTDVPVWCSQIMLRRCELLAKGDERVRNVVAAIRRPGKCIRGANFKVVNSAYIRMNFALKMSARKARKAA